MEARISIDMGRTNNGEYFLEVTHFATNVRVVSILLTAEQYARLVTNQRITVTAELHPEVLA